MTARAVIVLALIAAALTGGVGLSGAAYTAKQANPANTFTAARDWTAPTVALSDPGTPLRGTVTLDATAADADSTIASVAFAVRPGGGSTWTTVCTATAAPYTCSFDTTKIADGTYDVRALATDTAGNAAASVVTARTVDNAVLGVTVDNPGDTLRGSVTLTASATSGGTTITSVRLQIAPAGTTTWTTVCTDATAPYSCLLDTTKYAADLYDLRAIVTNAAGTTATSPTVEDVQIDNVVPSTAALTDPGATLRGVVTLSATAADAESGVAGVRFERAPAAGSVYTAICTITIDPYTCRFDTTTTATPDGSYKLRVVVTDYAGNVTTSTVLTRTIDNSTASVSLEDPGAYLRGTVPVTATPYSSGGVTSVTIRIRATGASTWTTICTATASPWTCNLNTTTFADGSYDLQASMIAASGATATSSIIGARRIDNSAMRGVDVQATNRTGGTAGRMESGDALSLTWSEAPKPSSLIAGWSGAASTPIVVRLRDGNLTGTGSNGDMLDFQTTGGAALPALGSVALRGNYVKNNKTTTFTASASLSGATLTVTLTSTGSALRTWTTATPMIWTPSSATTDLAGNPTSTAPVTESGTLDRDF